MAAVESSAGEGVCGEYLTIIQHPNGERKQICVRENRLLRYDENGPFVWYQTDTVGGSSGSPVFNNSWEVVALHHSGVPRTGTVNGRTVWLTKDGKPWTQDLGDDAIDWIANEGVRISQILKFLQSEHSGHPLANRVLQTAPAPWQESTASGIMPGNGDGIRVRHDGNCTTRILVPFEINMRVPVVSPGAPQQNSFASDSMDFNAADDIADTFATEAVQIDTTNYSKRNGYDAKFLGEGTMSVPLPKLRPSIKANALKVRGDSVEVKYWNYGVVIIEPRGLAFISAANIDPALGKGNRSGDGWIRDKRVDAVNEEAQIGDPFYEKQKTFEGTEDRSKNPFDKGHLTRREDLQWGRTEAIAKRNGDDSFHFPNCAPQHYQFNQNRKVNGIWNRLEQMTTEIAGNGERFCVFNGPIFDAPLCEADDDGTLRLNLLGESVEDPEFGGVRIPKQFFKVIVWQQDDKLRVAAFVVTQEDLLKKVGRRLRGALEASLLEVGLREEEVRLYQVKLDDLEHVTQLDFGKLSSLPFKPLEASELPIEYNIPIDTEFDVRL